MPKTAEDIILQLYARTPAPCRDYCGLTITKEEVILNIWNITFGPHVYPKRLKCPVEELNEHKSIKMEIERTFGKHVLHYTDSLSRNEMKLENLTTKAFLSVLNYLAAKDILNLSQTSKMMFERCQEDNILGILFRRVFKSRPSEDDLLRVKQSGWKCFLKEETSLRSMKSRCRVNNKKVENKSSKSVANLTVSKPLDHRHNKSVANLSVYKQPSKTLPHQVKNELQLTPVIKSENSRKLKKKLPGKKM